LHSSAHYVVIAEKTALDSLIGNSIYEKQVWTSIIWGLIKTFKIPPELSLLMLL
jgi:hypothetical protein